MKLINRIKQMIAFWNNVDHKVCILNNSVITILVYIASFLATDKDYLIGLFTSMIIGLAYATYSERKITTKEKPINVDLIVAGIVGTGLTIIEIMILSLIFM